MTTVKKQRFYDVKAIVFYYICAVAKGDVNLK